VLDAIREALFEPQRELYETAAKQLGTVDAGNHYVDLLEDDEGWLRVGVHFGSRGFEHKTATAFLAIAEGALVRRPRDRLGMTRSHSLPPSFRKHGAGRPQGPRGAVDRHRVATICELIEWAEDSGRAARAAEGALKRGDYSAAEVLLDRADSLISLWSRDSWDAETVAMSGVEAERVS